MNAARGVSSLPALVVVRARRRARVHGGEVQGERGPNRRAARAWPEPTMALKLVHHRFVKIAIIKMSTYNISFSAAFSSGERSKFQQFISMTI